VAVLTANLLAGRAGHLGRNTAEVADPWSLVTLDSPAVSPVSAANNGTLWCQVCRCGPVDHRAALRARI
jgi:hypothetical protein